MKKITQSIFVITLLIFTVSCGEIKDKKEEESKTPPTEKTQHESDDVLQLNNGNLWSANTETTQGIKNMISLMNSFTEKESLESYHLLQQNLEKEFGTIITKCSMQGESHNQLHNFLMPMKSLFKGLESSDLNTCKESYNSLNKHLLDYSNYFE
ncbi:hypothetical protein [uncultured Lutibacter sp.]|uniref:hypothetical protein n=1 Tax=uncultured Lutibacter sp. TaxID=437739 RepID=UPI00261D111E|nr:hypothetical protein [uncultured Lutibacter sp.]